MSESMSGQMAFDIFTDLRATDTPISEALSDIGFNRNNLFLDIADVGLVGRRAIDAAYLIVSNEPDCQTYDVDLGYFKWLMEYDSCNRVHLRAALREAQKAAIQVNDIDLDHPEKDRWVSVPLLGAVGISGGRIVFEVHETLRRHLRDPRSYTYLSLRIKARFSRLCAALLYDRLTAVAYRGGTEWEAVDTVRKWLQCSDSKTMSVFKHLRSRALDVAVDQINTLSDINVSYETRSGQGTKRIDKLKFSVRKKEAIPDLLALHSSAARDIYVTLRDEFGLSQGQFEEISANRAEWTDAWIQQAIEFTRDRINKGRVKIPSLFLMKAVRDGLRISAAEKQIAAQDSRKIAIAQQSIDLPLQRDVVKDEGDRQHALKVSREIMAALDSFDAMDIPERGRLISEFARSSAGRAAAMRCKVPAMDVTEPVIRENQILSKALGAFMATRM